MDNKRILYCASTSSHIMNFHLPYLRFFKEQGWWVDVAVSDPVEILYVDRVIKLPLKKRLMSIDNLNAVRLAQKLLSENQYDMISTHTTLAGAVIRLAVKMSSKNFCGKVTHTSHGYFFNTQDSLTEKVYLWVEKYLSTVTDVLMVMNEVDYQLATHYKLGEKIVHIPGMGIDLSDYFVVSSEERKRLRLAAGYHEDDFLIVYAAEMSKRKNQGELLRAFGKALLENSSMKLILAGEGTLKNNYEELARSLGIEKHVRFPGYVSDMSSLYRMCDLAVSTSRSEGLPFNVMEAMACGLPVVASRVKGHIDLLGEEQSEHLYQLGNEEMLTKIMLELLHYEPLREKAGEVNAQRVLYYRLDKVKPLIEEAYGERG